MRTRIVLPPVVLALAASSLLACEQAVQSPVGTELASLQQPIFGGVADVDHPEVMFLFNVAGAACSGTTIRTEEGRGFLLTAAHCVTIDVPGFGVFPLRPEEFVVVEGGDVAEDEVVVFPVEEIAVAPGYAGQGPFDDIAVVRYSIAADQAAPPAIEALAPPEDDLAAGDGLLLVGYGVTDGFAFNTQRRSVGRTVGDVSEQFVLFGQEDSRGACVGDSGGPGLVDVGGEARVGLVISTGISNLSVPCIGGFTVGVRVSAHADFIQAFLEN